MSLRPYRGPHPNCTTCRGAGVIGTHGARCPHCELFWIAIDFGLARAEQQALRDAGLMYEDELPAGMPQVEYDLWYTSSQVIDGVRMGPKV